MREILTSISSRLALPLATAFILSGCAGLNTAPDTAPGLSKPEVPPAWVAPLPHSGSVTDLNQWWRELGDPVLFALIDEAQKVSPGIASAGSRLAQARAALGAAQAANRPSIDASVSAQRGINSSSPTVGTGLQSNLGASWEVDVFGGNQLAASAAQARAQGAQAQWHEARVLVAAEVAMRYWGWYHCERTLDLMRQDARSRRSTADLAALTSGAGFAAPAVAGLARAGAAEANARAIQQEAQCAAQIKALVALTAMPEADLVTLLSKAPATLPAPALARIRQIPAAVLAQRPDMYAADREVAAASAELGSAEAQRYPRLMLAGSIGTLNYTNAAGTTDLSTWSVGPLVLSLPVWDGGRRAANIEAAQARYTEATALYQARARQAVREVEEVLLTLNSIEARQADVNTAASGYRQFFETTQARYQAGLASLTDLEDARRTTLAAQTTLAQLELERSNTWINLYRALGGGWTLP